MNSETFDLALSDSGQFIIDVGMNDGEDSNYYSKRGFRVVGIEANPVLCEEVASRFKKDNVDVVIVNRAVSNQEGILPFYVNKLTDKWSSLLENAGSRRSGSDVIEVKSCNLTELLLPICEQIHYAKIDIEGYDFVALQQILDLPTTPNFVSIENGNEAAIKLMHERGYTRFKYSNQKYVQHQIIPENSTEGDVIEHEFAFGSSGLFGDDLRGKWLSYEEVVMVNEAMRAAMKITTQVNLWAEAVGWFDLHAGKGDPGWR